MDIDVWYDVRNPQQWRRDPATLYAETLEQIAWADGLGFGAAWLSEHHFTDEGYLPALTPMLGAIAMRTTRMRLGTAVLLAPLYHPLRLAEELAVVDALCGGRIDLGIAPGYRLKEFEVMGVTKSERGTRTDEIIELLLAAWSMPRVTYRGRHFQFDDVAVAPKPVQRPHPPVAVGGEGPRVLERVLDYGDEWMPNEHAGVEGRIAELQRLAVTRGRDSIPVTIYATPRTPDAIERFAAAGAHRVVFNLPGSPGGELAGVRELAALIRPYVVDR